MRSEWGRFESLKERLLRAGVAPKRVRRYVSELSDHLDDLIRQQRAAGHEGEAAQSRARALLGSDEELARGWLNDPRLKSFTARAPWAVIPAVTVAMVILALALPILAWVIIGQVGGWTGAHVAPAPVAFVQFSQFWSAATNFLIPPVVALVLALVAHRQRLNPAWATIPMIILLPFALRIGVAPHSISVGAGLGLPHIATPPTPGASRSAVEFFLRYAYAPGPRHPGIANPLSDGANRSTAAILLQYALTFAPALWLALDRHWRRRRMDAHAV